MPDSLDLPFTWDRRLFDDLAEPEGRRIALLHYKRSLGQSVWDAAQLEGNPFTFEEVLTLIDGVTVGGHTLTDEAEVRGLIDSSRRLYALVSSGTFTTDLATARDLHSLVARDQAFDPGQLRGEGSVVTNISVSLGTHGAYHPTPTEPGGANLVDEYEQGLAAVRAIAHPVEQAIVLKILIARGQFFYDGNKRTSRHMMNGALMSAGHRAISVPARARRDYNQAMVEMYRTGDATAVCQFLLSVMDADRGNVVRREAR